MGYQGPYPLGVRCASEFLAMAIIVFIGKSAIANGMLPTTKGFDMGWGYVSFAAGLAFFIGIQMFGDISAMVNPAYCISLWVTGDLDVGDALALGFADITGGFAGAVLVWLMYMPHFSTIPVPPTLRASDYLMHTTDTYSTQALKFASYSAQPERQVSAQNMVFELYKMYSRSHPMGRSQEEVETFVNNYFHPEDLVHQTLQRRHSVRMGQPLAPDIEARNKTHTVTADHMGSSKEDSFDQDNINLSPSLHKKLVEEENITNEDIAEALEVYNAAVTADQNSKLAIFATRPAIFSPLQNWLAEFLGTAVLLFAVLMFGKRLSLVGAGHPLLVMATHTFSAFLVGMLIFVAVLTLGGPTGLAANPALDMGPRIAHFVLPIPGKGSSEFIYAWIPFTANYAGGACAGALYLLVSKLYEVKSAGLEGLVRHVD